MHNTYYSLGDAFYDVNQPTTVRLPQLLLWNQSLAEQLQLPEALTRDREKLTQLFTGNQLLRAQSRYLRRIVAINLVSLTLALAMRGGHTYWESCLMSMVELGTSN